MLASTRTRDTASCQCVSASRPHEESPMQQSGWPAWQNARAATSNRSAIAMMDGLHRQIPSPGSRGLSPGALGKDPLNPKSNFQLGCLQLPWSANLSEPRELPNTEAGASGETYASALQQTVPAGRSPPKIATRVRVPVPVANRSRIEYRGRPERLRPRTLPQCGYSDRPDS